jgi:hypothetical protein
MQGVDFTEEVAESQIVNVNLKRAPGGNEASYPEIGMRIEQS